MEEIAELRVSEEFASLLFKDTEGKRLSASVRKIEIKTTDLRYPEIGRLQREINAKYDTYFFAGWIFKRKYSVEELQSANLFSFCPTAYFEPAGEERGTIYDESFACRNCGTGAKQIGPLFLSVSRIPKGKDFAITIAGEIAISQRAVKLFKKHRITGVDFGPVRKGNKSGFVSSDWFQLIVQTAEAEIIEPTRVGVGPFDDDQKGEFRCSTGDLLGLNLLSEVTVRATTRGTDDFISSRQFIGTRRGLLRPERIILISQKVRKLIESEKLKGCKIEVAHLA
jgi:hypothetical protein